MSKSKGDNNQNNLIGYSDSAIRNNSAVVQYCRTSMAALSGCTAGNYRHTSIKNKIATTLVRIL